MKKVFAFVMVSILVLGLTGCGKITPITVPTSETTMTATTTTIPITVPTSPVTTANFNPAVLANTTWVLKSYGDVANMTQVLTYPQNVTLTFNSTVDRWYGDDSVNDYGGACHIENNSIAASEMTQTLVLASDPALQKQADTYDNLLMNAKTLTVTGNELIIYCSNGQALQFSKDVTTTK
jgi:heat shock protein HslJ